MKLEVVHGEPVHPDVFILHQALDRSNMLQPVVLGFREIVQDDPRGNLSCPEVIDPKAFQGIDLKMGSQDL